MDKSGVFFRFYGRTAGDLIAFRLLDEYNTNKERKMRMQQKTPDHDNVFKTMKMKHKRLVSFGNDLIVKLRDSGCEVHDYRNRLYGFCSINRCVG